MAVIIFFMHFRFRGNNIQIVKSQPDPKTGKAKSRPLGSINRATLAISEKLRRNCSPEELRDIEEWVRRYRSIEDNKRQHAALTLPEQIAAATQWFAQATPEDARQVADDIVATMAVLRRMLHRRGLI